MVKQNVGRYFDANLADVGSDVEIVVVVRRMPYVILTLGNRPLNRPSCPFVCISSKTGAEDTGVEVEISGATIRLRQGYPVQFGKRVEVDFMFVGQNRLHLIVDRGAFFPVADIVDSLTDDDESRPSNSAHPNIGMVRFLPPMIRTQLLNSTITVV